MHVEEFRARSVTYRSSTDRVEIVTTLGEMFPVPRGWIPELWYVPMAELAHLAVWPDGSAIELDSRDIHISVHGLLTQWRVLPFVRARGLPGPD